MASWCKGGKEESSWEGTTTKFPERRVRGSLINQLPHFWPRSPDRVTVSKFASVSFWCDFTCKFFVVGRLFVS